MSRSKTPITIHSERTRSAARRSTGETRASETIVLPSPSGSTQLAMSTRTVPGSDHMRKSSGP